LFVFVLCDVFANVASVSGFSNPNCPIGFL
jgi:hypothetical protein